MTVKTEQHHLRSTGSKIKKKKQTKKPTQPNPAPQLYIADQQQSFFTLNMN